MSALERRRSAFIGLAGVSLAAAGYMAPGAYAANTVDGDVTVSNTETVQVLMDAAGKIDAQRIYEQVELRGKGKVDLSNPVSTKGLRNLDGFGGFDVRDDQVRIKTDVDGVKQYRSVSDFTKDLPVEISVSYLLDGKKVEPGDIVGKSGDLQVQYEVRNTTGVQQDVTFPDGEGVEQSRPNSVVIPMVGSLTTVLPSNFTRVQSAEANAAGDGRGGTQMSFTMTLIPPIGSDRATFGYTARITDGVVPEATLSMLPVNPLESPSFSGGAASYKGGAESGQDLTAGATEIDANVLKLAEGASDLVSGIFQLKDGADQLSAGLNNDAVPGAQKLAAGGGELDAGASKLKAGTGDLTAGAKKLNAGAGDLADGLETAADGGPALLQGVADLTDGANLVDQGLVTLRDTVNAGGAQFKSTFASSVDTNTAGVAAQLAPSINGALDNLNALVQASSASDVEKATFAGNVAGTKTALNNGIAGALTGPLASGLKAGVNSGVDQITGGVAGGVGDPATADTLRNGMARIIGGLAILNDKGGELAAGLDKLSAGANQLQSGTGDLNAGANQLNAGAGDLKAGTGQLADGAGQLASGLGDAASGSSQLADGLGQAAESAPALPDGANQLSEQGTSQLVNVGNATASDYGLKYALIEAGAERASSAQPYGSPEGATALTAYKFEIAGEDGAGSANVKRGIAGVALLAGAGALAAFRRRSLLG
jgi:putative membrane protein